MRKLKWCLLQSEKHTRHSFDITLLQYNKRENISPAENKFSFQWCELRHGTRAVIANASSKGSGEYAGSRSLARTYAVRARKQ